MREYHTNGRTLTEIFVVQKYNSYRTSVMKVSYGTVLEFYSLQTVTKYNVFSCVTEITLY